MLCWLSSHFGWITAGGIGLLLTLVLLLKGALYRYVLRKLRETESWLEIVERIYGDGSQDRHVYIPHSEIVQKCRLLWRLLPLPSWLEKLALQWEDHKRKGRL